MSRGKIRVGGYVEHAEDGRHGYGHMRVDRSTWAKQVREDGSTETVLLYYCRWNSGTARKPDWQTDPFRSHELRAVADEAVFV